jgi:hypothetical protein
VLLAGDLPRRATLFAQGGVDVLATGRNRPGAIVVDANRVYWLDMDDGSVWSTRLFPGGAVNLHSAPQTNAADLVQDAGSLYFPQFLGVGSIYKASKAAINGEGVIALAPAAPNVGIAFDPTGNELFFQGQRLRFPAASNPINCPVVIANPATKECATIMFVSTAGGDPALVTYLANDDTAESLSTDDAYVYWAHTGLNPGDGTIRRAPLGGASNLNATLVLAGLDFPYSIASPASGSEKDSLFWLEDNPAGSATMLRRRSAEGVVSTLLNPGPVVCLFHCFAVRDGFIYTEQSRTIVSVSINGGTVTPIVSTDPSNPTTGGRMQGIAVDDTHIYWATSNGKILRVARSVVPGAPRNLTAQVVGGTVTLTWDVPIGGGLPIDYVVEAGTGPGLSNIATGPTNTLATTFTTSSVANGTYYWRVRARNAVGASLPSNEVSVTVESPVENPPGAPSVLAATSLGSSVTLTWVAPASGGVPTTCVIEAGSASGLSNLAVVGVGGTTTTFSATAVPNGNYYVRVRCRNAAGTGGPSNEVLVAVRPPGGVPSPPSGLTGSISGSTVTLSWAASAANPPPTTYSVEAGSAPGLANLANFFTGNTATTLTAGAVPDGTYYARVRAANAAGISGASNETTLIVSSTCSGELTATLTWNTGTPTGSPTRVDLDLHAAEPDGTEVSFGNDVGPTIGLVNDNQNGLGPERICARGVAANGVYWIDVAAYAGNEWPTTATITITTRSRSATFTRVFQGPDSSLSQSVADVTFPGGEIVEVHGTNALDQRGNAVSRIGGR